MKRTIIFTACLLLAALLLIGGCGKPTGEGTGTNAVPTAAGSGSEIVITSPEETSYVPEAYANYERDDLPENLNNEEAVSDFFATKDSTQNHLPTNTPATL